MGMPSAFISETKQRKDAMQSNARDFDTASKACRHNVISPCTSYWHTCVVSMVMEASLCKVPLRSVSRSKSRLRYADATTIASARSVSNCNGDRNHNRNTSTYVNNTQPCKGTFRPFSTCSYGIICFSVARACIWKQRPLPFQAYRYTYTDMYILKYIFIYLLRFEKNRDVLRCLV